MKYFGTDGIRGSFGDDRINEEFFERLGAAAAAYAHSYGAKRTLALARDTRESAEALARAFARGARGVEIFDIGVAPTPVLAYATKGLGAGLGVMITASHNPHTDNGIKFFDPLARKIGDEAQEILERFVDEGVDIEDLEEARVLSGESWKEGYVEHMASLLGEGALSGMKVALDSAHGATVGFSSEVFRRCGARLFEIGNAPDGRNINDGVGSEHVGALEGLCRESCASIGFAHDGDGDRLVVCDENASVLSGEEVLALIAIAADAEGALGSRALVTTMQSNLGLDEALMKRGIRTLRSGIGDRLVMQMMLENGCNIGGENSGHYIFSDISPCGDGLAAAIQILRVLASSGKKLSELRKCVKLYPSMQEALKVARKTPLEQTQNLSGALVECEGVLNGKGRILVRYSGTENKIRLLVESPEVSLNERCFAILKNAVQLDLQ